MSFLEVYQGFARLYPKMSTNKARGCLWMLFENFQRARLQLVRIKTDQETFMDELKNPKDTEVRIQARVAMFSDVHYLSICLNKIRELLDLLRQLHSNKNLREIMRNYGQLFRESNEFRNNLDGVPHTDQE